MAINYGTENEVFYIFGVSSKDVWIYKWTNYRNKDDKEDWEGATS